MLAADSLMMRIGFVTVAAMSFVALSANADFLRPRTTRRYLHGPFSQRVAVFFREGKITLGENIHRDDWSSMQYWKGSQPAHGIWLVHGPDDAAFPFEQAMLGGDPNGVPVHSQTWRAGDLKVSFAACSPCGPASPVYARLVFANCGAAPLTNRVGFLLRSAPENKLVFGAPDIYKVYAPRVEDWRALPSTFDRTVDDVFCENDRFVAFGEKPEWDPCTGVARFPLRLPPGGNKTIELVIGKGEIVQPGFAAAEKSVRGSWAKVLKRVEDRTPFVRGQVVQILQCIGQTTDGRCALPRQGGLQRFVWPGEFLHVAEALDRLGYRQCTAKALDFFFHFAKPDGQIGPFANGWASETAYVLEMLARHCLLTDDEDCWRKHHDAAVRGFKWMAKTRAATAAGGTGIVAGLFPPRKSTDSTKSFQHWGMTDLANEHALKVFGEALSHFNDPFADVVVAEWRAYRGAIEQTLEKWRQKLFGKDTFFLPLAPDGSNEEKFRADNFFYLHPGAFVEGGYLTEAEMLRLRTWLVREGIASEKGLYQRHPSSDPSLGERIWYTTWSECQWAAGWRRVGRSDLSRQALDALRKWSVTDEGYVGERISEDTPWYFPWSPNASGSARILKMVLDEGLDKPCEYKADAEWIPIDVRKTVVPGSAVDFSHFAFRDAPAGKHGWLKARDGQFVFEGVPNESQRFWGVNLCNAATCPTHEDAERIVTAMVSAGYNTMRIHHYESTLVAGSADRVTPNREAFDRLDYLFAKAKECGIYTTTDLFVSRPIYWRDIGFDKDGRVEQSVVKGLFLLHEPAFENWKAFARNLLTHVNPYTGLRYADDPAMPFVVLVNEGAFAWEKGRTFDLDVTRAAWKKWLAERRKRDPKCFPTAPDDCLGCRAGDDEVSRNNGLTVFVAELERRFVARARGYLRSLGVKALVSDWNCMGYPDYPAMTSSLDYVDAHFYVDHPVPLGNGLNPPVRVGDSNPGRAKSAIGVWMGRVANRARVPYSVSEWNFCAPGSCRGAAGLLVGACAARLDWNALWRFDYIGRANDLDDESRDLAFFTMMRDPFMVATERAGVLLFRRRELAPLDLREDANYLFPVPVERDTGRFTIATDRTVGCYGLMGDRVAVGPLVCRIGLAPAVLWASAVDEKPLVNSNRILLTHLTDLKAERMRFEDATHTTLLHWGTSRQIVRRGTAEVSLALHDPASCEVWSLETNGARKERVSAGIENGCLSFVVDVRDSKGKGRLLYEVVRK